MSPVNLAGKTLETGRTYVVAEMAWSHDGSKEHALEIVRAAASGGADCISVHLTDVAAYMVPHYGSGKGRVSAGKEDQKIFEYLQSINIRNEWWPEIFQAARDGGLAVAAMPNDLPSLELARELAPDMYVLPAACFTDGEFVSAVAAEGKAMLLRVGGATLGEMESAIGRIRHAGCSDCVLLYGQQNYPTQIGDTELRKLPTLKTLFDCPVGLADHVDAEDPMALAVPLMAVAMGASVVEKHLTYDRSAKGEDHESALNPGELAELVTRLRAAEAALGDSHFEALSESQQQYRLVSRKRIVAAAEIPAGTELTREHLATKRSDVGLYPESMDILIGRTVNHDLAVDEGITLECIG